MDSLWAILCILASGSVLEAVFRNGEEELGFILREGSSGQYFGKTLLFLLKKKRTKMEILRMLHVPSVE